MPGCRSPRSPRDRATSVSRPLDRACPVPRLGEPPLPRAPLALERPGRERVVRVRRASQQEERCGWARATPVRLVWGATCRVDETTIGVTPAPSCNTPSPTRDPPPAKLSPWHLTTSHPVQGAQAADQAAGMHDLRRPHPRKDAMGAAGLRRKRVAVYGARQRRVPAAAKRAGFRTDASGGVAGIGVPDPSQTQGSPSPSRQPDRPTRQATAGKLRLARAAPQARTGLRGGSPPGGHRPSSPRALRHLPAHPPSPRTLQRWHHQRRWLHHPP